MFNYFKENTLIRMASYIILLMIISCSFISGRILNIRREIQEAKGLIEAGDYVQQNFEENLISYLNTHKKTMEKLQTVRPQEKEMVSFINQLEKAAKEVGLEVTIKNLESKPDQEKEKEKSKTNFVEYNIFSYGTEEQLLSYLEEIETFPYYLKIENLSYKNPGLSKGREPVPNINFIFKLFIK